MDVEFAIPTDLPTEDAGVVVDSSKAKETATTPSASDKTVTTEQAREFIDKHKLIPLVNALMTDVLLVEPEDPIDHMTRWFLRHAPATDDEAAEVEADEQLAQTLRDEQATRNTEVSKKHADAVRYCSHYKLPTLIDELLSAMILENPQDQGRFAMSWLRWNKKKFVARHKPAGYKAYLETQGAAEAAGTGGASENPGAEATSEAPAAAAATA